MFFSTSLQHLNTIIPNTSTQFSTSLQVAFFHFMYSSRHNLFLHNSSSKTLFSLRINA